MHFICSVVYVVIIELAVRSMVTCVCQGHRCASVRETHGRHISLHVDSYLQCM